MGAKVSDLQEIEAFNSDNVCSQLLPYALDFRWEKFLQQIALFLPAHGTLVSEQSCILIPTKLKYTLLKSFMEYVLAWMSFVRQPPSLAGTRIQGWHSEH